MFTFALCICAGLAIQVFAVLSLKVKSAIQQARRSLPVEGNEAMAIAALLQLAETLQFNLKGAIKEDEDWYRLFMPLTEEVIRALKLKLRTYCL